MTAMSLYIPIFVSVFSFVIVTFVICRPLTLKTNYLSRLLSPGPTPALQMNVWHWFIYFFLFIIFVLAPSACAWVIWLGWWAL
jgi:hypothetical protein